MPTCVCWFIWSQDDRDTEADVQPHVENALSPEDVPNPVAEEEPPEPVPLQESALECGARLLLQRCKSPGMTLLAAAELEDIATRHLRARLEAAAESCVRKQSEVHSQILNYVFVRSDQLRAVAYLEHCSHDSTPMKLRTQVAGESYTIKSKVFVSQLHWAILLAPHSPVGQQESAQDYLLIRGSYSLQSRVLERGTGEAVLNFLMSTQQQLPSQEQCRQYPEILRLTETDEDLASPDVPET